MHTGDESLHRRESGGTRADRRPDARACPVSVVIVNYKSYEELDACLESLSHAGPPGLEVIVVDHSSSAQDLARIQAHHPLVRLCPIEGNPGFSAGVNTGARLAAGRHILILNPDARVERGAVEAMVDYLDSHPRTAVVGARVKNPDGTVQRSARRFPTMLTGLAGRSSLFTKMWPDNPLSRRDLLIDAPTTAPSDVDWVAGSCMAVRTEAFAQVGGMDEQFFLYWEDADLCKRLREANWSTVYLPSADVVHDVGRSRRHARALAARAFHRSAYLYFAKHRAGRFRAISLPVAGALLWSRMVAKLTVELVTRRD
jgi:GT2 family glycosyltransferase